MPRLLERLHTLWTALRLRLRGGAPGVFYIGGSDTMPAPLDREAEQQAIRALTAVFCALHLRRYMRISFSMQREA